MKQLLLSALTALTIASKSVADEAWTTMSGDVIYLADHGDTAILQQFDHGDEVRFYFPGLGGNFNERSVHQGFWVSETGGCGATMMGPDGFSGRLWGPATIVFHEPAFPSGWTVLNGLCFDEGQSYLEGEVK